MSMTDTSPLPSVARDFAMSELRRAIGAAAASLVTYGIITPEQKGMAVQVGIGAAVYGATMLFSWWKNKGQALAIQIRDAQLARLKAHLTALPSPSAGSMVTPQLANAVANAKVAAAVAIVFVLGLASCGGLNPAYAQGATYKHVKPMCLVRTVTGTLWMPCPPPPCTVATCR